MEYIYSDIPTKITHFAPTCLHLGLETLCQAQACNSNVEQNNNFFLSNELKTANHPYKIQRKKPFCDCSVAMEVQRGCRTSQLSSTGKLLQLSKIDSIHNHLFP